MNPVTSWLEMREAIASYAMRAADKMRRYKVAVDNLFVFMHSNTFNQDPFYSNGAWARFAATTTPVRSLGWRFAWANGSGAKTSARQSAG